MVRVVAAPQLDYAAGDPADRLIASRLERQEHAQRAVLLLKLLFGVPASFLAPLVVASLAVSIARKWGLTWDFPTIFTLLSVLCIPLIYWWASRRQTDFFSAAASEWGGRTDEWSRTSSYGEWEMRNTQLTSAVWADLFFWGPNIVVEAYRAWHADRNVALASRVRAVHVVKELWAEDGGMPVKDLLSPGESPAALAGALRYLECYQWVDASERRDRVWLLTEARERLGRRPR